jgi:hypothetical protein
MTPRVRAVYSYYTYRAQRVQLGSLPDTTILIAYLRAPKL